MAGIKKSEAIKNWLNAKTHPDLAALYSSEMEVQVEVARDGHERLDQVFNGRNVTAYTDGVQVWRPIRIPYNASTTPENNDTEIGFDLAAHANAVGMTGWNWERRVSQWFGYDFDTIAGHSDKHSKKLTDAQLQAIAEAMEAVPYATIRRSTGGRGLHVYVFVDDVPTENHTEHAALARAVLDKLSLDCGADLRSSVDVCGSVLWVWHRKMASSPDGLRLIKQGEILRDVPRNWKDHIPVVSGKRTKTIPGFVGAETEDFDELSSHRHRVTLDKEHRALIQYLGAHGAYWSYDTDHNMLITHTAALKNAHDDLGLRGVYSTNSQGSEAGDHNCFAFPIKGGSWAVRRYTKGTVEHDSWEKDDRGWMRCFLNKTPDFRLACLSNGGIELAKGGYEFDEYTRAMKVLMVLGIDGDVPLKFQHRTGRLKEIKGGKIEATIAGVENDERRELPGWRLEKKMWSHVYGKPPSQYEEPETVNHDAIVRCLVGANNTHACWAMNTSGDEWIIHPKENLVMYLRSIQMDNDEVIQTLGNSISKFWRIVNKPFQPEYPGNREWNRFAARLKVIPTLSSDALTYPHWEKVLKHCGKNLEEALAKSPWAKVNGVTTGAQYLKLWIASMIKHPDLQLPYLFFYGNQNSGKSMLHEAISMLIDRGCMQADQALTNPGDFNGELEHAVFCYIEEQDLGKNKTVYNRVKEYVTGRTIMLHVKYMTPHMIQNMTHWMQFANHLEYAPAFPGDSRVVICRVDDISPIDMIPKQELERLLLQEAPDFLRSLLDTEIPPTDDRLNVPAIVTSEKRMAMEANMNMPQQFIDQMCHVVPGESVALGDLFDQFQSWLEHDEKHKWTKQMMIQSLPPDNQKGRHPKFGNAVHITNLSFSEPLPGAQPKPPLKIDDKGVIRVVKADVDKTSQPAGEGG